MEYQNKNCRDITRNIRFNEDVSKNPNVFYPHVIPSGTRSDMTAYFYYDDPYLDWMIYHTNKIIDPYYGWYLSENDFNNYIIDKYGSMRYAMNKVKHYQLDATNGYNISVEQYNTNLPYILKKYYTPNYGIGSAILSYKRVSESWTVNTNKILAFSTSSSNVSFVSGDLLTISNTAGYPVGQAEVYTVANSTMLWVKNISGNTDATNTLTAWDSNASVTIIDKDIVQHVISDDEYVYWQPVSIYEYERELNEANKNILMLDASVTLQISEDVREKLKTPVDG